MTALIKVNPQLPAAIQRLTQVALASNVQNEFSGGVTSGFPIFSYKGKVWGVRKGGEMQQHLDADGNALPTIDVVLVRANPNPSKIYYAATYTEGDNSPPTCFSNDGIKPDASVQNPQNPICANCPKNAWGSKVNNGKKLRACADARRMAVVMAHELAEKGKDATVILLRVPAASLNPLKDYVEKTLAPKGIPPFGVITRIGFDAQESHPQFTLKATTFLDDDQADAVIALRESEDVRRILAESEFATDAAGAATVDNSPAPATAPGGTPVAAAPATTASVAAKPPKVRPASEEEAGLDAILGAEPQTPAAAPTAPAPAAAAPKPAAKPKPKPAKAAPAPAAPAPAVIEELEETTQPTGAVATPPGFENLLDSILNS